MILQELQHKLYGHHPPSGATAMEIIEQQEDYLRYVLRCVNTHDGLVKALEVCLERLDEGEGQPPHYHRLIPTTNLAKAALAAAKGQQ
jgi:hypothetical protein